MAATSIRIEPLQLAEGGTDVFEREGPAARAPEGAKDPLMVEGAHTTAWVQYHASSACAEINQRRRVYDLTIQLAAEARGCVQFLVVPQSVLDRCKQAGRRDHISVFEGGALCEVADCVVMLPLSELSRIPSVFAGTGVWHLHIAVPLADAGLLRDVMANAPSGSSVALRPAAGTWEVEQANAVLQELESPSLVSGGVVFRFSTAAQPPDTNLFGVSG